MNQSNELTHAVKLHPVILSESNKDLQPEQDVVPSALVVPQAPNSCMNLAGAQTGFTSSTLTCLYKDCRLNRSSVLLWRHIISTISLSGAWNNSSKPKQ